MQDLRFSDAKTEALAAGLDFRVAAFQTSRLQVHEPPQPPSIERILYVHPPTKAVRQAGVGLWH